MSNKDILKLAISCGGIFLVANGVKNMVQDKDYAALKVFSGGVLLTCYYTLKCSSSHKKMKKMLDEMFSSKTILTRNQLLFRDSKSKTEGFGVNKRIFWTRVEIEQDSFKRFVPPNMRSFWNYAISNSIRENLINGKSIKESLLSGLFLSVKKMIPDFDKNLSIRDYVDQDRMIDVFSLKLVYDVYQKVEKCQNDEAVLDFLKKGFWDKTSPFYECHLEQEETASSFFHRTIYEEGKEKEFKVLDAVEKISIAGSLACSLSFPMHENPLLWVGLSAAVASVYSLGEIKRDRHLKKQFSRFESDSFVLQDVQFVKMSQSVLNGYFFWYQRMKNLTKMEQAKLTYQIAEDVEDILKIFPQNVTCKEAAFGLFVKGILKEKQNNLIYKKIEKGATLESVVKSFGLKPVYRLLMMNKMIENLKSKDCLELRSFMFEFQSELPCLKENMLRARKKISKRAYRQLNTIKQRYEESVLSEKERKEAILRVLEEEDNGVFMQVPIQTKLPNVIKKVLKEDYVKN